MVESNKGTDYPNNVEVFELNRRIDTRKFIMTLPFLLAGLLLWFAMWSIEGYVKIIPFLVGIPFVSVFITFLIMLYRSKYTYIFQQNDKRYQFAIFKSSKIIYYVNELQAISYNCKSDKVDIVSATLNQRLLHNFDRQGYEIECQSLNLNRNKLVPDGQVVLCDFKKGKLQIEVKSNWSGGIGHMNRTKYVISNYKITKFESINELMTSRHKKFYKNLDLVIKKSPLMQG
ncbi:MAG: hypothetical protein LBU60_02745 [Clostridiales bacterium]|jgi:Ca2+/Na+ antiporter|nr:hypothetical protein [Clostridiales bacterium]